MTIPLHDFLIYASSFLGVLLMILLFDMLGEMAKPEPPAFKWGDAHRREKRQATWASHMMIGFPTILLALFFGFRLLPKLIGG